VHGGDRERAGRRNYQVKHILHAKVNKIRYTKKSELVIILQSNKGDTNMSNKISKVS